MRLAPAQLLAQPPRNAHTYLGIAQVTTETFHQQPQAAVDARDIILALDETLGQCAVEIDPPADDKIPLLCTALVIGDKFQLRHAIVVGEDKVVSM